MTLFHRGALALGSGAFSFGGADVSAIKGVVFMRTREGGHRTRGENRGNRPRAALSKCGLRSMRQGQRSPAEGLRRYKPTTTFFP